MGQTVGGRRISSATPLQEASRERLQLLLLWAAGVACAGLMIASKVDIDTVKGMVFNEMLVRLLQGRFDMSPATIGYEAFVYKGHTYAYFGIFCALIRLPLLLVGQIGANATKLSVLCAAAVSLGARLAALNLALGRAQGVSRGLRLTILGGVTLGGESLQYLRPDIYQEVCSWGAALAAVFVLLAVLRVLGERRRAGWLYAGMASMAGLALLCRVSYGLGLSAALGAMLCVEAWRGRSRLAQLKTLAPAAVILALFMVATGGVNAARWDDPFAFVPMRYQRVLVQGQPDRLQRMERYGEVNVRRIPFALQYYFAPVWELQDRKGDMLLQKTQLKLFDCVELPPSSLLLSDAVVCLLAGAGLWALARRRAPVSDPALAWGALAGLACSGALMLVALSLAFRYRMEFYPALDFAACIGAASLRFDPRRQPNRLFLYLGGVGAALALISQSLYAYTPHGPALDLDMRGGWTTPIMDVIRGGDPNIAHMLPDGRRVTAANPG